MVPVPPTVSIVVRSHNDIRFIRETLSMLLAQDFPDLEILSCDDASTDGTAACIDEFSGIRKLSRPEGAYVPGRTLNIAVQACRGEIIVFNNADAVPCAREYISELVAPFFDPAVAAVYGNQLCREDATFLVRKDHERAFGDGILAARWGNFFSLASSAIRRQKLLQYPFSEKLQYSEDIEWAQRCRARGEKIAYAARAQVRHSHNYTLSQLKKRFYNEGLASAQIFAERQSLMQCLGRIAMETLRDFVWLLKRNAWREIPQAPLRRFAQKFSCYQGERDFFHTERVVNDATQR